MAKALGKFLLGAAVLAALGAGSWSALEDHSGTAETLRGELTLPGSPYKVEYRILSLPETESGADHITYGIGLARNGDVLLGVGNNKDNASLFRFNPVSETILELGDFKSALPPVIFKAGEFAKVHAPPYEDSTGTVWTTSSPAQFEIESMSGRLFALEPDGDLEDMGVTPANQGVYFMLGDKRLDQMYVATTDGHFHVFDPATRQWRGKGRFTSKPPLSGLFDWKGRLYVFGYDGEAPWTVGPPTISRFDPETDELETSRDAPPTLWVGAITPDGRTAYTSTYLDARLHRWRFDEWPDYDAEALGRIDPDGRAVYSNNMSLTPDGSSLVIAGTVDSRIPLLKSRDHGIWLRDMQSGRTFQIARLNRVMRESMGSAAGRRLIYWNNTNTVDEQGWIWIGAHTMPADETSVARILGIRVQRAAD